MDNYKDFKLRIYVTKGPRAGDLLREEYFDDIAQMHERYLELFNPNNYALNPTAWRFYGVGWSRLAGY